MVVLVGLVGVPGRDDHAARGQARPIAVRGLLLGVLGDDRHRDVVAPRGRPRPSSPADLGPYMCWVGGAQRHRGHRRGPHDEPDVVGHRPGRGENDRDGRGDGGHDELRGDDHLRDGRADPPLARRHPRQRGLPRLADGQDIRRLGHPEDGEDQRAHLHARRLLGPLRKRCDRGGRRRRGRDACDGRSNAAAVPPPLREVGLRTLRE
mmetsp:Transcript_106438/g.305980  ORF Transcript_106438/g.305980 Transcript_106438/m.305980 type:complete len:207 (+) Transcript_106438:174-794(+)